MFFMNFSEIYLTGDLHGGYDLDHIEHFYRTNRFKLENGLKMVTEVEKAIDALDEIDMEEDLRLYSDRLKKADALYNDLPREFKGQLEAVDAAYLSDANKEYRIYVCDLKEKAEAAVADIGLIPNPSMLTEDQVVTARILLTRYDELSHGAKEWFGMKHPGCVRKVRDVKKVLKEFKGIVVFPA